MKITFIQTGGSIDKDYPRPTKGYAFEITEPAVKRILKYLDPTFDYEIIPLLQKDSLDITDEDREIIYTTCRNSIFKRIIITHGTDTLIETAEKLSVIKDKIIVLTGSMRPEWFRNSDAPANLGAAIGAVQILEYGVYIVMHGKIHPWDKVSRDEKSGLFIER